MRLAYGPPASVISRGTLWLLYHAESLLCSCLHVRQLLTKPMLCLCCSTYPWQRLSPRCHANPQATRLVKNSLIAIEPTDVEVDDPEAMAEEDALAAADARPGGDAAAGPSTGEG